MAKGSADLPHAYLNSGPERLRTLSSGNRLNRLGNYSGRGGRCDIDKRAHCTELNRYSCLGYASSAGAPIRGASALFDHAP